ncbi:hypothetical protein CGRA01v4_08577 [Colletotrichum graminicola]|nr:hypothetical protein CGRA01v4_08577 [Colletotrichum graminicola]
MTISNRGLRCTAIRPNDKRRHAAPLPYSEDITPYKTLLILLIPVSSTFNFDFQTLDSLHPRNLIIVPTIHIQFAYSL